MSLFKSIQKYKNNIALISNLTGPITYSELVKQTMSIKKCIPERSLVFLITQNTVAPLICYISSIRNNYVVLMIDIKTNAENVSKLFKLYNPTFIIAPKKWLKNSKFNNGLVVKNIYDYAICKTSKKKIKNINLNLSLLLPTSGSMGSPKFVRLSNKNLKINTDSIIKSLNIKSKDRTITTMPYSYSYMLSIINTYIESGASIVVCNYSIFNKEFWEQFKKNKITSLSGVPYIYEMLIKLGLEKIYIPSLKILTQAGGKLNNTLAKKIIQFCKNKKIKFFMMYGQTEASARMSLLNWKDAERKIESIGKPIPFTKMWIEDNAGKIIKKPNIVGELIFKGKNVSQGYCNNIRDLKKKDTNKGILKTGDLATFDEEGFFYIKGRKNRIIKIFGNRFSLDEIENSMLESGIKIICKEDNEKLLVFFESDFLESEVLKRISNITGQNKIAFKCISIKSFPRTMSGKIDYVKLGWHLNA